MNNRFVFVSGAAGGIGKVTSEYLADSGFNVFAADMNKEIFNIFFSENIIPLQVDITDKSSIKRALMQVQSNTNQLCGLINIAGIFDQFPLVEAFHDAFEKLIRTNLTGHQLITNTLFPLLYQGHGRVINMSSETVMAQMPLQSYAFSKKLFDGWNTQLRMELNLLNMKVIAIRAGGHVTPFIDMSTKVIGEIDEKSLYKNLMGQIKIRGQHILKKTKADPIDIASKIYHALTASNPKSIYNVNVSLLFRILAMIPSGIRESMINLQLKKWM